MQPHPLIDPKQNSKVGRIVSGICKAISEQQLVTGSKLPSIRQLAKETGISIFTVTEAYQQLVQTGWITPKAASGFYVTRRPQPLPRHAPTLAQLPLDTDWLLSGIFDQENIGIMAGCGWLPESWYDEEAIVRLLRKTAREQTLGLRYGQPKGLLALRAHLSERLQQQNIPAEIEQIITTQGATHALALISSVLRLAGQHVLVDDPGYCNLISSLHYQGCQLHGVPWTNEGPDLTTLEALIIEHKPRVFFTNPWQQNPTGASYSPRIAHGVLRLAQQYDLMIVEDNVSADLLDHSISTLAAIDSLNRVIYLSSYSKSMSPSLRVGYIAAPATWSESIMRAKMLSGLTTPTLNEQLVLALSTDNQWRRQQQKLKHRIHEASSNAISQFEEAGWEVFSPHAKGMFIWAKPPAPLNSLQSQAHSKNIFLAPGKLFRPNSQDTPWWRFNAAYLGHKEFWTTLAAAR